MSSSDDAAEGEVEAQGARAAGLGDLVLPVGLGWAAHDEQRAVPEGDFDWGMVAAFVPQEEAPRSAQTQRGDRRVGAQLWLVVAVPAHAVAAVAVLIE